MPRHLTPNPRLKFRILCKRCNSYQHTTAYIAGNEIKLECSKCGNKAASLTEEFERE